MQHTGELNLSDFPRTCGEWLQGRGADSDVVISSRIRLARNIRGFNFPIKMTEKQKAEVVELVAEAIRGRALRLDLNSSSSIDRALLVERHLISKELANGDGARSVIFGRGEMVSIMVNEEDHLRIQCIKSGFDLDRIWARLSRIDRLLERQLPIAFDDKVGYLTACPTNVGTGMRVSVMLHLPCLTMKEHIRKVQRACDSMNLALRGLYGEGTQALGDFYQISNQATLGKSEEQTVAAIKQVMPVVIKYERGMREALLKEDKAFLEDRVERALATLRAARQINVEEMMQHMSMVRLGLRCGLIPPAGLGIHELNELFLLCQPAHLQKHERRSLTPEERNVLRADIIRNRLSQASMN
ncbi:MAG: protein arginine kinase [Planctomycetaceae bacterium]|nr:protein arginine kinase [Planctomycetaceae bacterium]